MKLLISILISINLYANVKQEIFTLYKNHQYKDACVIGYRNFHKYSRDEEYVSLYAFSCLKSDYVDRLATPIVLLKFSKDSRANAAYFSVILMQKKLLYHALMDGYNLENLNLPTTNYILSKVFDAYLELGPHQAKSNYLFTDHSNSKITYKLYLEEHKQRQRIIIEEFHNSVIIKKHIY